MKRLALLFTAVLLLLVGCDYDIDVSEDRVDTGSGAQSVESLSEPASKEWTEEEIRSLFDEHKTDESWEVKECAVISDFAVDRVGVVLFTDGNDDITYAAFLNAEGDYQMCGVGAALDEESEFTYCGGGAVTFKVHTSDGMAYTCKVTMSRRIKVTSAGEEIEENLKVEKLEEP